MSIEVNSSLPNKIIVLKERNEGRKVAAFVGLNTTNPAVDFISVEFPFISLTSLVISALADTTAAAADADEKEEVDNDDGILDLHFNSSVTVF